MASSSKTTRECTRAPKCSILLNNILAITLSPSSLEADQNDVTINDTKPQQLYSGKKLFDSFIENNKSSLNTRLNESLSEARFAGWIQPFTILIKGPQEEMDVLTEAWRRRFLRSPDRYVIRELGTIKSIDTEVIQQAPFLPLTKAVYEAISALNQNNLPSGQKQVFEYLAHTYQYVHVPKPNVIRDCLGILFKEGKVFANENNEYFVNVDSESERTLEEKKELKSAAVKEQPKDKTHPQCMLCEEEKGSSSTHLRKRSSRHVEHAALCDKHKHLQTEKTQRKNSSKESTSIDTSMESKELKHEKKDKKCNGNSFDGNVNKKTKVKGSKKTIWGHISGLMKGKSCETKDVGSTPSTPDATIAVNSSLVSPKSKTPATPNDNDLSQEKIKEPLEERMTPLGASLSEKQVSDQLKRSRSFTAQSKKRSEISRSNSFTASTNKQKAIDFDIETRLNEVQRHRNELNMYHNGRPASRETDQSSTADKTIQKNTEPVRLRNNNCTVGVVRPYTENNRAESLLSGSSLSRSNSMKNSRKMVVSMPPESFNVFRDSKRCGSSTPTSEDVQRTMSRESRLYGQYSPSGDVTTGVYRDSSLRGSMMTSSERTVRGVTSSSSTLSNSLYTPVFRDTMMMGSVTPPPEFKRPVMRDSRSVARSLSLREHRSSDITPLMHQRTYTNMLRDHVRNESPLNQLLTKNTGNTLPVSSHPSYIPGTIIQDRSRPPAQRMNSFPNNNSIKRSSWRTMSKDLSDDCTDVTKPKTLSLVDDNLRIHDKLFSPIHLHQNQRMLPCDCSETGYSENSCSRVLSDSTEPDKPARSDQSQSSLKKYKNERSNSMYSTSDNGILLDEISSSCSSEIQSIVKQEKRLDKENYTVAKGEVVLDSSLTFIGII